MTTKTTTVIQAVVRGGDWSQAVQVRARGIDSGLRTAARKLGLSAPISRERVGSSQWAVNCDGVVMMAVVS